LKRRGLVAVVAALGALGLAGCYAQTEPASDVGSTSATLNAHGLTTGKQGQAFFQYSTSKNALGTGFGLQTPTLTFPPNVSGPFTARVSGLSPGTNYWYRVCGNDVGDQPFCNSDLEFTTTVPGAAVAFGPPLATAGTRVLATGDFNGDGVADLVVGGSGTSVEVLLNDGDATFREGGTLDVGASSFSLAVGDFNRDGQQDLVVAVGSQQNTASFGLKVFPGRGDGSFGAPVSTANSAGGFDQAVVGDFNRDGKPDVALIAVFGHGAANTPLQVMLGNGNGTFQPPDQNLLAERGGQGRWNRLVVGDFNRDGRLDMAASKAGCSVPSNCGVSVFLGNGNGTFGPEQVYDAGTDALGALVTGAFHGGSTLDLITRTTSGLTVLNGKGDGTFQVGATYTGTAVCGSPLQATDINGDGKLDVVCDRADPTPPFNSTVVQLGNGDGTLQNPIPVQGRCTPSASADLNGDGKPDIACRAFDFGSLSYYSAVILNATPPPG
jgi:VCBS repeat protein